MKPIAILAASALLLTGCSAATPTHHRVSIVASTDVYGSIAHAIGGSLVDVTSIIDDPAQDPHSYEANARVQLELSKADIVIENGAGYDDFVDTMLDGVDNKTAKLLNVATISAKPIGADFNEHLWYDFPTMERLVIELVSALSAASPADASKFEVNAENFVEHLDGLEAQETKLSASYSGTHVATTEPVPGYLLEAVGLKNVTPPAFSEAIEEGRDVAPAELRDTLALFTDKKVALLAYNEQTTGPQTAAVLSAAYDNDIPVFAVTETLPAGSDYLRWMSANLAALDRALR